MKLQLNKYYETKNGNVVYIWKIDGMTNQYQHYLGRTEGNPRSWKINGECTSDSEWDIVSETHRRLRDTSRLRAFNIQDAVLRKPMCFRHNPDVEIKLLLHTLDVKPRYRFVVKYDDILIFVGDDGWGTDVPCEIVFKPHSWTDEGIPLYDY